jgi:hypothetical protein
MRYELDDYEWAAIKPMLATRKAGKASAGPPDEKPRPRDQPTAGD